MKFDPKDVVITSKDSGQTNPWVSEIEKGVKIVHIPTNITITCEEEKSQHRNRTLALQKLEQCLEKIEDWEVIDTSPTDLKLISKDRYWEATITIDGCVYIKRKFNTLDKTKHYYLEDNLHICNLDDMIKKLLGIRALSKSHFGNNWG